MKLAILGFEREGRSVLNFVQNREPARKGARTDADEVWVLDKKPQMVPRGIKTQFGKNYLKNLGRFDIIFRSPGVPYNLPELVRARKKGVRLSSATKLFFDQVDHLPSAIGHSPIVIGITGTKGKGTTATLLYEILKAASRLHSGAARSTSSGPAKKTNVFLAGNIGKPALDLLPRLSAHGKNRSPFIVLELSSFQLQDLEQSPHIAVILDVFPDHQDAHLSLREYYAAKANITSRQKQDDKVFYFANSAKSAGIAAKSRGKKIAVDPAKFKLFAPENIKMLGYHNFKNAVMAAVVALSLGASKKTVVKTVRAFRGLEHRLEFVRAIPVKPKSRQEHRSRILKNMRILFYNDSASTNPRATAAAINAFGAPSSILNSQSSNLVLIAGGRDKKLDYKQLARALRGSNVKFIVLYGENRHKIKKQIANSKSQIVIKNSLASAVKTAYRFAKKLVAGRRLPVAILFSPGATSLDQFRDYADRGEQFKKIARRFQ